MKEGNFERSGSSFGKHYGSCFLSPLNMALVCVFSYSWVIFLSLSHTNPMSHYTPLAYPKSALVIITLWFVLSLSRVNVSKSLVMPHNVQGKFHPKSTTMQHYQPSSLCQFVIILYIILHYFPMSISCR